MPTISQSQLTGGPCSPHHHSAPQSLGPLRRSRLPPTPVPCEQRAFPRVQSAPAGPQNPSALGPPTPPWSPPCTARKVYFSDAASIAPTVDETGHWDVLGASVLNFMTGQPSGRLLVYDPVTGWTPPSTANPCAVDHRSRPTCQSKPAPMCQCADVPWTHREGKSALRARSLWRGQIPPQTIETCPIWQFVWSESIVGQTVPN